MCTLASGMSSSVPSGWIRRAVFGCMPSSARMAAEVCERARNSSICPSSVSDTITEAASKYTPTRPPARKASGKIRGASVASTLYVNADATPMPISVHMFGLRVRIDAPQRTKNGQPAHSTTGADRTSSIHDVTRGANGAKRCAPIASATPTTVSGSVHQKRRVKSSSSGLRSSSSDGISGSSAMPQIGQKPGAERRICGCIGQT